jgi:hypothetical protein
MKSLLLSAGRYICKVYNYHDSRAGDYKRSVILPRIDVWEWFRYGYGLVLILA